MILVCREQNRARHMWQRDSLSTIKEKKTLFNKLDKHIVWILLPIQGIKMHFRKTADFLVKPVREIVSRLFQWNNWSFLTTRWCLQSHVKTPFPLLFPCFYCGATHSDWLFQREMIIPSTVSLWGQQIQNLPKFSLSIPSLTVLFNLVSDHMVKTILNTTKAHKILCFIICDEKVYTFHQPTTNIASSQPQSRAGLCLNQTERLGTGR